MRYVSLMLVVGTFASAVPLFSQSTPHDAIALVHGKGQTGGAWVSVVPQLQSEFALPVYAPSLGTSASWSSQASALHTTLLTRNSAYAISHSNGGPVTRHYLRTFGASTRVNSHFSMGSPHLGAPIAARALDGHVSAWLGGIFTQFFSTINFYVANDPAMNGQLPPTVAYLAGLVLDVLSLTSAGLAVMGYLEANNEPVLHDLRPSSPNVAALAEPSFAFTEASAFTSRTSLVTELSNGLQPYSLIMSSESSQLSHSAVITMANQAWAWYEHYSVHPNPWLRAYAGMWALLAYDLADIQLTWQVFIGAAVVGKGGTLIFNDSDGLIPWDRSFYAGAQQLILARSVYGDIPHVMQQHNQDVLDFTVSALESAGIPAYVPPNPEPPPPFTLFINGTGTAQPGNTCGYFGGSTDAATPYSLSWSLNGTVIGTDPSIDVLFTTAGVHELMLAILDADGKAWMKYHSVNVSSANPPCLAQ